MKRISIILLSEPLTYPPTINAANILAENDWIVDVYGIKYCTTDFIKTNQNVNLFYIGSHKRGILNIIQYIYFYFWSFFKIWRSNTKLILSYDPISVGPSYFISRILRIKWFYHVHDVLDKPLGWYKLIKSLERIYARKANNISFPQEERALMYRNEMNIQDSIDIVYNGPRENWGLDCQISNSIFDIKKRYSDIVIYQGGISLHFNFEVMLNAMKYSKSTFAFCIIGRELQKGALKYYNNLIADFGLTDRVFFLPPTTYDKLPSYTRFASIGLAKFTSNVNAQLNDYYLIGASNKVTEYTAMALPILLPKTPVNEAFLLKYNIGITCNTDDYIDLANTIDLILNDSTLRKNFGENASSIFKRELNFDKQFTPILKKIEKESI